MIGQIQGNHFLALRKLKLPFQCLVIVLEMRPPHNYTEIIGGYKYPRGSFYKKEYLC